MSKTKKRFETDKVLKNNLRLKSSIYANNVDVNIFHKHKYYATVKTWVKTTEIQVKHALKFYDKSSFLDEIDNGMQGDLGKQFW